MEFSKLIKQVRKRVIMSQLEFPDSLSVGLSNCQPLGECACCSKQIDTQESVFICEKNRIDIGVDLKEEWRAL